MRTIDSAVAAGTMLLGAWVSWTALGYGYQSGPGPGPGFFPFWVGLGMIALGAVNLYRSLARIETIDEGFEIDPTLRTVLVTGIVAAFVVAAPWIGMIPGAGLMVFLVGLAISKTWDRGFLARLAACAVGFPVGTWLLFSAYLDIRMVEGVFGL